MDDHCSYYSIFIQGQGLMMHLVQCNDRTNLGDLNVKLEMADNKR